MRRFLGYILAGALLPCCTPRASAPVLEAPTEGEAPTVPDTDAPVESDGAAEPEAGQPSKVPERVDIDINEDYAKQTNPERWAGRFEREGREVFDHRDAILDALGLREGMAVADVGAGTGLFTLAMAAAVGSTGKVYAVDVQSYFLDHIGQEARAAKLDNVVLVRADQGSAKLPEGSVDLVLMVDSYHHVEQPASYLASLFTALRPGGRLVVVDYIAIEGTSEAWLLEHVRATPTAFRAELEGAGFRFVRAHEGVLEENFVFELERP